MRSFIRIVSIIAIGILLVFILSPSVYREEPIVTDDIGYDVIQKVQEPEVYVNPNEELGYHNRRLSSDHTTHSRGE